MQWLDYVRQLSYNKVRQTSALVTLINLKLDLKNAADYLLARSAVEEIRDDKLLERLTEQYCGLLLNQTELPVGDALKTAS